MNVKIINKTRVHGPTLDSLVPMKKENVVCRDEHV